MNTHVPITQAAPRREALLWALCQARKQIADAERALDITDPTFDVQMDALLEIRAQLGQVARRAGFTWPQR